MPLIVVAWAVVSDWIRNIKEQIKREKITQKAERLGDLVSTETRCDLGQIVCRRVAPDRLEVVMSLYLFNQIQCYPARLS